MFNRPHSSFCNISRFSVYGKAGLYVPVTITAARRPAQPRRYLMAVPLVAVSIGAIALGVVAYLPSGIVAPGVHLGGLILGGLARDAAQTQVDAVAAELDKQQIVLKFSPPLQFGKSYSWRFTAKQLGLSVDTASTLKRVMETGRSGAVERVAEKLSGKAETHIANPVPLIDEATLAGAIKTIAHTVHHVAVNARMSVSETGELTVVPGKPGLAVDVAGSAEEAVHQWTAKLDARISPEEASHIQGSEDSGALTIELKVAEIPPAVTPETLAVIDGPISEMKTRIRGSAERVRNVTLATQHIDGTVLAAGETFSYNKVVGRRSEEGGYKKATIFVKGRHVEDVGGGICQTASTLYNAVLRGGLKVVRRQPHSTPVVYVPYGLDATVSYGSVDFQFLNDTEYPVYVYAKAKGRSLTFRLYSKKDPKRSVVLEKLKQSSVPMSRTVVVDQKLAPGKRVVRDKGAPGFSIVWRRTILEGGEPVRSETIKSHYKPVSAIVAVGPGGVKRPAIPPSTPSPGSGISVPVRPRL